MGLYRKLLRRLFYTAAALSTLLLATLIVWPVSYFREMAVSCSTSGVSQFEMEINSGRLTLFDMPTRPHPVGLRYHAGGRLNDNWSYFNWRMPYTYAGDAGDIDVAGVEYSWFPFVDPLELASLKIPFFYLALLFSILPLLALRAIRRRRRLTRAGLCSKCGYDLRAHAIGDKCPECGTPVAKKP